MPTKAGFRTERSSKKSRSIIKTADMHPGRFDFESWGGHTTRQSRFLSGMISSERETWRLMIPLGRGRRRRMAEQSEQKTSCDQIQGNPEVGKL